MKSFLSFFMGPSIKRERKDLERNLRKLSLTERLCYLFMCVETYLVTLYPERDWTPVAKQCWPWTKDYWNKGWDVYSAVVPEYLLEFEGYEKTNTVNYEGMLPEEDYQALTALFQGLTTGDAEDEINQVLQLPLEFSNLCEGASLSWASYYTMDVFHDMQQIFSRHNIPLPDMRKVRHLTADNGWGGFVDSESLSIILPH